MIQQNEPETDEGRALDLYSQRTRLAGFAVKDVEDRITSTLRALGDPHLVRGTIEPFRIKSLDRLRQKAGRRGWTLQQAIEKAQDFIGFRLVCDNLQDVRRASDLIRESLSRDGCSVLRVDDYVAKPKKDGYRAVHMVFALPVTVGNSTAILNCELQIRSRLQNTWAHLSRVDLYSAEVPPPLQAIREMKRLSELLAKADNVADRIRQRIARPRHGRKPTAGQTLKGGALAFLYHRRFGQDAPDYLIQSVLRDYGHLAIRTDGLEAALEDESFIGQLSDAYSKATRFDWEAAPEQIFRWVLISMVSGTKAAIAAAARDSRQEANEIEQIGRREALSSLPRTAARFLAEVDHPDDDGDFEGDIEQWASGFGVLDHCGACGREIVDPYALADAAVKHFKLRGKRADRFRENVQRRVSNSAVDTGGWNHAGLCSNCDYQMSKDD